MLGLFSFYARGLFRCHPVNVVCLVVCLEFVQSLLNAFVVESSRAFTAALLLVFECLRLSMAAREETEGMAAM